MRRTFALALLTLALAVLALLVTTLVTARARAAEPDRTSLGPGILRMRVLEGKAVQGILTPVPIDVELPADVLARARRVLVHYRVWGDPDWTTIELLRSGRSHRGAIPCLEVSTITGDVRYYLRIHDAEGRVVAYSASRAEPYRVTIVHDTTRVDGAKPRARCPDPADCPPNFPGCGSGKQEVPCSTDADCEAPETCGWGGLCEDVDRRASFLALGVGQGFGVVSTSGACTVVSQESRGYACFRESDGEPYFGNPVLTNEPLGFGVAQTRFTLGYDHVVFQDASVGVRATWAAFGVGETAPKGTPFFPFSLELRATRFIGRDPFASAGPRPFVFVGAGGGMFDVRTETRVRENPLIASYQGGNALEQTLDVTRRAGDGYVAVGAGVNVPVSAGTAPSIEIELLHTFPYGATIVIPTLGVALGW